MTHCRCECQSAGNVRLRGYWLVPCGDPSPRVDAGSAFLQEIDTFLNCIGKAPFGSGKQLDCSIALAVETTARVSTLCPGLLFGDEVRLIRSEQLSFPCSEDDSELEIQRRQFSVSTNEPSGRGLYFRTIETRFLGAPRHQQRFVLWKRRRDEVNKEQHKENQSEE